MPAMPEGVGEGILRGIYKLKPAAKGEATVQLFGSGPILNEVLRAQEILAAKYGVHADVWSVTSYTELRRDALAVERWNRLHPAEKERVPYLLTALGDAKGPIIAASDYMKSVPDVLSPWLPSRLVTLGTDGFGRSDNREHLRRHFEISAEAIVGATLVEAGARRQVQAEGSAEGDGRAWAGCRGRRSGESLTSFEFELTREGPLGPLFLQMEDECW